MVRLSGKHGAMNSSALLTREEVLTTRHDIQREFNGEEMKQRGKRGETFERFKSMEIFFVETVNRDGDDSTVMCCRFCFCDSRMKFLKYFLSILQKLRIEKCHKT